MKNHRQTLTLSLTTTNGIGMIPQTNAATLLNKIATRQCVL